MLQMSLSNRRNFNNIILVACMISFALVSMFYDTARASTKHLIAGGLIGAGAVLAWPAIIGGVSSLAGGAVAMGTAAAGAIAVGGAAVGGAIAGTGAAVGGAVTAGFGAVGGAVAAIAASPLFLPALIIAGVVIAGVFVYKHFKDKKAKESVSPFNPQVTKSSGRITESVEPADKNKTSDLPAVNPTLPSIQQPSDKNTSVSTSIDSRQVYQDDSSKAIKDRYTAAYQNYVRLLESDMSNGSSPEILKAFEQLKSAQTDYRNYLDAHPEAVK